MDLAAKAERIWATRWWLAACQGLEPGNGAREGCAPGLEKVEQMPRLIDETQSLVKIQQTSRLKPHVLPLFLTKTQQPSMSTDITTALRPRLNRFGTLKPVGGALQGLGMQP